jgi:hypothetical protein
MPIKKKACKYGSGYTHKTNVTITISINYTKLVPLGPSFAKTEDEMRSQDENGTLEIIK